MATHAHEEKERKEDTAQRSYYRCPKWLAWGTGVLLLTLLVLSITLPLTVNKKSNDSSPSQTCSATDQLIPKFDQFTLDPFDELEGERSLRKLRGVPDAPHWDLFTVDPFDELETLHTPRRPNVTRLRSIWDNLSFEERLGQITQWARGDIYKPQIPDDYAAKWEPRIKAGTVGSFLNVVSLFLINRYQKMSKEANHLPLLFGLDVIHGYSTIFPINIGMAAAFDRQMIYDYATVAAKETLHEGIPWTFAPMLDVSRDPRWGRMSESAGEDPYLAGELGVEYVKGFQDNGVAACVKHLVAYGAPIAGLEYNTVDLSDVTLFNDYYPGYKKAMEAGAWSAMGSYNTIKGMPSHAHRELMNDMVRGLWNFHGMIVSDYAGIANLLEHKVAKDLGRAAVKSLEVGIDMAMGDDAYQAGLKGYVSEGGRSWDDLMDDGHTIREHVELSAKRVLVLKERIGLFDNDGIYPEENYGKGFRLPEYMQAAQKAAEKSAVLLKNKDKTLPMAPDRKVLLVGMLADSGVDQIGFWSAMGTNGSNIDNLDTTKANGVVTAYDAFVKRLSPHTDPSKPDPTKFVYTPGYTGTTWTATLAQDDAVAMKNALALLDDTNDFDYIVYYAGESRGQNGEGTSRTDLTLSFSQSTLLRQIKAKIDEGKRDIKLILVTQTARPAILSWEDQNCDAILQMWAPGSMGGPALLALLYGDVSPSGKLPVTYPRNMGQIPVSYTELFVGKPYYPGPEGDDGEQWQATDVFRGLQYSDRFVSRYIDSKTSPLYQFGFGLSYTTFTYTSASLNPTSASASSNATLTIKVTVTNDDPTIAADEIVQIYVRPKVAALTPHKKRLRQFQRVSFAKKQGPQEVTFNLHVQEDFGYFNNSLVWVVEPGDYDILVAKHSDDESTLLPLNLLD